MTYEALCATSRAAAADANVVYVPYTALEYLELINRPAHSAHVAAVAAAIAGGQHLPLPSLLSFFFGGLLNSAFFHRLFRMGENFISTIMRS
jgi:hypothetical protein